MKQRILSIILMICIVAIAMGAALDTARWGYSTPVDANTVDDTLLTDANTTMQWADLPAQRYRPDTQHNAIEIAWTMDSPADSCTCTVYAYRKGGDLTQVWTGTLTAGTQGSTDGREYVDTIASSTDTWISTVKEIDGGGNNRMSRIVFDTCGYAVFFCQFENLSSESIKAYYSGY